MWAGVERGPEAVFAAAAVVVLPSPEPELEPPEPPIAAGLSRGISVSGGGGIGVGRQRRQRLGHLRRCLVALGPVLGHHLLDDGSHCLGHVRPQRADRLRLARLVPDQLLGHRAFVERGLSRQAEIERGAEAVDVGPDVHAVAVERLFRSEVVGGAQHALVVFLGEDVFFVVEEASQAHVEDLDDAVAVDEDVARLDVAVDQAGRSWACCRPMAAWRM